MGGGLLISLGLMTAAFGDTLPWAYLGLGVLCGTGGGFVLPTSYIVINQYFKEKRSKAFAISTAGMGIGAMAFAPVLAYWFSVYGYNGALFVNAGLFLNLLVAGALMRPPPKVTAVTEAAGTGPTKIAAEPIETDVKDDTETEILTSRNDTNLNERSQLLGKARQRSSKLRLLTNPTFVIYMFNIAATTLPQVLTYIPSYGLEIGISTGYSSVLLSANGFMDIVGRIGSGFFFDRVIHGRKRMYHSIVGVAAGIVIISMGFAHSVSALLPLILAQGFIEAIFSAQRTVTPFEYVDAQDMSDAVGMIIFAECLGTILGPIMQATIKDTYGSHSLAFVIGGAFFGVTSFIMLIDYIIRTVV